VVKKTQIRRGAAKKGYLLRRKKKQDWLGKTLGRSRKKKKELGLRGEERTNPEKWEVGRLTKLSIKKRSFNVARSGNFAKKDELFVTDKSKRGGS